MLLFPAPSPYLTCWEGQPSAGGLSESERAEAILLQMKTREDGGWESGKTLPELHIQTLSPPCPHLRPNLHHSASPFPESTRSPSERPGGLVQEGRAGVLDREQGLPGQGAGSVCLVCTSVCK